jgi:hypothetical protein
MCNRIVAAVLAAAVMTTLALPAGASASSPPAPCTTAKWVTYKVVQVPSGYAVYQELKNNCGIWGYRVFIEHVA